MKQRSTGLMIVLSFVTLGIYNIIWHFKFQEDVREETGKGILPWGHILINLVPILNIIYQILWHATIDKKLEFMGARKGNRAALYIILLITVLGGFFVPSLIQSKANNLGEIELNTKEKTETELRVDKYAKYFNK